MFRCTNCGERVDRTDDMCLTRNDDDTMDAIVYDGDICGDCEQAMIKGMTDALKAREAEREVH